MLTERHCRGYNLLQVNVPTFDFIDLPGIQSLPEEDRIQTERLVNSYISDSNTLVLCVMEGTDAVLDKGNALKVVIDANKLGSTILALTKSDKVHEDDTEDYIFKRILLEPGSTPALLEGLKGCVAVVNRKHQDSALTLEQAADKELQVFAQMLHEAEGDYKAAAMQRRLGKRMTSKQLVVMLNKMYHAHITSKWVDETLTLIADEASKVKGSLQELGPEALSIGAQMATLNCKVCLPICLPACLPACLPVCLSVCSHACMQRFSCECKAPLHAHAHAHKTMA